MIVTTNLEVPIVLIVVGIVLYALLGQMPEPSRPLVTIVSTILVVIGVIDLLFYFIK